MIQIKATCLPPAGRTPVPRSGARDAGEGTCPYLERNDCRCSARFSIGRLDQMFEICLGPGMAGCFLFHRIKLEDQRCEAEGMSPTPDLVEPTHDGRAIPLRPTGS